jgi:phosphonopyruvate decarboxylase
MISTDDFCASLAGAGFSFVAGVPCSYFSGPIKRLTAEGRYLAAANEGAALAAAAGAQVAGARSAVIAQNSGLGNLVNPLTSLVQTYGISVLVLMSLRGWPDPAGDEPQHAVMGTATHSILDAVGVPHITVPTSAETLQPVLEEAEFHLARGRSVFLLMEKGSVEKGAAQAIPHRGERLTRLAALEAIRPVLEQTAVVSTTGYTSRELFGATGSTRHFYMQGSMGHAAAFGLGVALREPSVPVVVLDGDGAAIMHLGTLSSVGAAAPGNFVHVVFDNGSYESTGGQATTSHSTDFRGVALAAGYRTARNCRTTTELREVLADAVRGGGPHLVAVPVASGGGMAFERATAAMTTDAIRDGFAGQVAGSARAYDG